MSRNPAISFLREPEAAEQDLPIPVSSLIKTRTEPDVAVLQVQYQQPEAGGLQVQSQPRKPERWLSAYNLGWVPRTHMVTHDYL